MDYFNKKTYADEVGVGKNYTDIDFNNIAELEKQGYYPPYSVIYKHCYGELKPRLINKLVAYHYLKNKHLLDTSQIFPKFENADKEELLYLINN